MSPFLGVPDVLFEALRKAGVVTDDPHEVRRVVIDVQAGKPAMVYVEKFADLEKLVVALEGGLRVVTEDAP